MDIFIKFIKNLAENFTWPRFFIYITCLVIFLFGFSIFNAQTGYFKLKRIEKQVALLAELTELNKSKNIAKYEDLYAIYKLNVKDLREISESKDSIGSFAHEFLKVFFAMLPWILMILYYLPKANKGSFEAKTTIRGVLFLSFTAGFVGFMLPYFNWYINYLIYPFGHFVAVVAAVVSKDKDFSLKRGVQAFKDHSPSNACPN